MSIRSIIALTCAIAGSISLASAPHVRAEADDRSSETAASFRTVTDDTFDQPELASRWSVYTGQPSSDPWTRWRAEQVRVRDGKLILSGRPRPGSPGYWETGGVSNWRGSQTYGRWTVKFRSPPSSILSYHFLLWPKSENWPPEVDLAESFSPSRRTIDSFVHYRNALGERGKDSKSFSGDFTRWNTISVTWTPSRLVYHLNGAKVWELTGSKVPNEPMFLALQTETQLCDRSKNSCATDTKSSQTAVEIDQVKIESYQP